MKKVWMLRCKCIGAATDIGWQVGVISAIKAMKLL